jgi:predicted DNA-binding protein
MKDEKYEKKVHVMHIRISEHDYERLRFLAEKERRTVSNAAHNIIISYLDHFESEDIWNRK